MNTRIFNQPWLRPAALLPVLGLLCATPLPAVAASNTDTIDARAAFEKLKGLAGDWEGQAGDKDATMKGTVSYKVIGGGSAVVETLFSGTPHEMITVYHLDGKKLMLTHYCAAGNQPRMVLTRKSTPQQLDFDFAGGTNLKASKDVHMHALRIRFENQDRIAAEWDCFENGKLKECKTFALARKS